MVFLSQLDGLNQPLTLGFVHTGNIFVQGKTCKLGGFENTLLGFQPRRWSLFADYKSNLDVLMFGKCSCVSLLYYFG